MTVETPRRAPLGEWATRLGELAPALRVAEQPFLTHLSLRVRSRAPMAALGEVLGTALPRQPCTFASGTGRAGAVDVAWLGPDEYLVMAAPGIQPELESLLRQALDGTAGAVVDVSAQRTTLSLAGPAVRDVLAHGCAIDLHPRAAPAGTCVQTLLARTGITLLVRADDEFTLLVRQSFAPYLAAWLVDAAAEYRTERT